MPGCVGVGVVTPFPAFVVVVGACVVLVACPTTPTQAQVSPGMVANCNKFHYVSEGNTCQQIISYQGITLANFVKWNTGFGSNCNDMWAKAWACVGVM